MRFTWAEEDNKQVHKMYDGFQLLKTDYYNL